ncbi:MAG: nuclear transport factor 2 family protein, partial [Sphingopyxis terrae]
MSVGSGVHPGLAAWHAYMAAGGDPETLRAMLADDAVFHSPVVHSP